MKRIVIGATGASGLPLLITCLEILSETEGVESHLIFSEGAKLTLSVESDRAASEVEALADVVYDAGDIGAAPASGSFVTDGMLIVPCSMKTLAGIHSGYADSLLLRAADVTLKERRKLVLCTRETPLSPIHLRNMQELSMIPEVHIIPPMLGFYYKPQTIDDMLLHNAAKLLSPFGIETKGYRRWKGCWK